MVDSSLNAPISLDALSVGVDAVLQEPRLILKPAQR
jgi:hypothetical protein